MTPTFQPPADNGARQVARELKRVRPPVAQDSAPAYAGNARRAKSDQTATHWGHTAGG
jgi:hypothetical protein